MAEMTPGSVPIDARLDERWKSLVDILYLGSATWLYVVSLVYPAAGLFFGILFLSGSVSPGGKRVGRVCLILGIINTVIAIFTLALLLGLGTAGMLALMGRE